MIEIDKDKIAEEEEEEEGEEEEEEDEEEDEEEEVDADVDVDVDVDEIRLLVDGGGVDEVVGIEDDELGVGVGVGEGVGEALLEAALDDEEAEDPEPPSSKTTTSAVRPEGTVTTQKLAPPAPEAWSALVTPPIPTTDGSIEQGSPLHPDPEHSILIPKVGMVSEREEDVQIGFQPILR